MPGGEDVSRAHARAVLVLLPTLDERKQERLGLAWATDHRYAVTSVTTDPEAAAALAEAGLVDVIMIVRHTRATLEMAGRIRQTGVAIDEARPSSTSLTRQGALQGQILDAARRGVPVEAIAAVLDVPIAAVVQALGGDQAGHQPQRTNVRPIASAHRRPRLLVGPPRRP